MTSAVAAIIQCLALLLFCDQSFMKTSDFSDGSDELVSWRKFDWRAARRPPGLASRPA
jgi:hypothetical protein